MGTIDGTDGFTSLYVAGGRLIGLYHPSIYGAGGCISTTTPLATDTLVASDDGGATWHDTATTIETQGYRHNVLAAAGQTLFTAASQVTSSTCVAPTKSTIWSSADGGRTWSMAMTIPAAYLYNLSLTSNSAGTGYFGVIWATTDQSSYIPYYSSDGGATWAPLPMPTGRSVVPGIANLIALPDGDVLAGPGANDSVYRLRPGDAHPGWTAIAPGSNGTWQVVSSNGVTRLWSSAFPYRSSPVEYLTLSQ